MTMKAAPGSDARSTYSTAATVNSDIGQNERSGGTASGHAPRNRGDDGVSRREGAGSDRSETGRRGITTHLT